MKRDFENAKKVFTIPHKAWFAKAAPQLYKRKCINVRYDSNLGGTYGEFDIEWSEVGLQLKAYNDSWEALSRMPELIEAMAAIDREQTEPSIEDFADLLISLGYQDNTSYERED